MSKRKKELAELVAWSADAAMTDARTGSAPPIGSLSFGALAMNVGFDEAERLVIAELSSRFILEAK